MIDTEVTNQKKKTIQHEVNHDDPAVASRLRNKKAFIQKRKGPGEDVIIPNAQRTVLRWTIVGVLAAIVLGIAVAAVNIYAPDTYKSVSDAVGSLLTPEFGLFVLVGLIAQVIDGALGMAYGVSATSFLLSLGVSQAMATASVHMAELFTSGVSGLSHLKFGNVNKKLFRSLVIPGAIGAAVGAYLISYFGDDDSLGKMIKPFVAGYILIIGLMIIRKAFVVNKKKNKIKRVGPLALVGGFMDSIGGGGWGPIVTSNLIASGRNPKYTIGSVNLAEFFICLASGGVFTIMLKMNNWQVIAGLIVGGVMAAPFAALAAGKMKPKTLMIVVGVLVSLLSIRTIFKAVGFWVPF